MSRKIGVALIMPMFLTWTTTKIPQIDNEEYHKKIVIFRNFEEK